MVPLSIFIAALQQGGRNCIVAPLVIPLNCCSDMLLFSASELDVSIMEFQHSSQSSLFFSRPPPFSTFMDSAFLFCVFFDPDSGQRDGCCVMSVIVLILPFSQHFNLFMLLPNLYWAIICILYMIIFPLPVVLGQLQGLLHHASLCNNCCCSFDMHL